jgi:nitroreductase / dihydropteridine reductase
VALRRKKYNGRKIAEGVLGRILTAINLYASLFGLQPYRVFLGRSTRIKKELGGFSFNPQVTEAPHLLVFAAFTHITEQATDTYISRIAEQRGITTESLEVFKYKGLGGLLTKTNAEFFDWALKQAYIALGTGLVAAAAEHVDAIPMEGFHSDHFDSLLGLQEKGLKSVAILSLGYRDEHDTYDWLR